MCRLSNNPLFSRNRSKSIDCDAYTIPAILHRLLLGATLAKKFAGHSECGIGGSLKIRSWLQSFSKGPYTDLASFLPRKAAELCGNQVKRMVRNSRVRVYAALIASRIDIVGHVSRLWIFTNRWIVIRRTRSFHRAQHLPLMVGKNNPLPISQSAWSAVWFSFICRTRVPKTSEMDSFSAPDWF